MRWFWVWQVVSMLIELVDWDVGRRLRSSADRQGNVVRLARENDWDDERIEAELLHGGIPSAMRQSVTFCGATKSHLHLNANRHRFGVTCAVRLHMTLSPIRPESWQWSLKPDLQTSMYKRRSHDSPHVISLSLTGRFCS
jgi:hypothetical protein